MKRHLSNGEKFDKPRQWEFAVRLRKLKPGLCDKQERWHGVGGGKEVQEEGDICIPMADSC